MDLHKPNNKLISAQLEHLWCTDEPWANTDSQDSPRPGLGGNYHLPPYSIVCAWPRDQHPNIILSWDSQVKVPKFPKLRLLQFWRPIILCEEVQLRWGLKKSCSLHRDFSNNMWHATYTQGSQGDAQLLMVESQSDNLIFCPSFAHNWCFNHPNGSCEPILNIYVPRAFQWYKELHNPMGFDPCNHFLKIWKSIRTPTPKVRAHLGVWRFIHSHSPTLLGTWDVILRLPSWPASLQALALVANPRLGLQHNLYKNEHEMVWLQKISKHMFP
jgi:hypothetical protein